MNLFKKYTNRRGDGIVNIRPIILAAFFTAIFLIVSGCDSNTVWPPQDPGLFRYVGLETCAQCHSEIVAEFPDQAHGLDFRVAHDRDLIGGYGGGCAPCHTVGFDEPSGFVDDGTKIYLEGIGCEECHGMGNQHAASPSTSNINRIPNAEDTCWICHLSSWGQLDNGPIAMTDADLALKDPDSAIHHPQAVYLQGWWGYNRTDEPGAHKLVENTCATCHITQEVGDSVDHGADALHVDFGTCAACHTDAGQANALFLALEHEILTALIDLGGEDPEDPGHPDHDATGGLLGAWATANAIVLDDNTDPDNPAVMAYKAARHNFSYILADASMGTHNPGFTRNLIADAKALLGGDTTPPIASGFVGRAVCATCHIGINAEYGDSAHGLNFRDRGGRDLIGGYGGGCAPCHTVGFEEPGGYDPEGSTPELEGIGCEECHGQGGDHANTPSKANIMRIPDAENTCWDCHVNSYKIIKTGVGAMTDADLYEDEPGGVGVHHPQTLVLVGTQGYNRTDEPGTHMSINNSCVACHMDQSPGNVGHDAESLHPDFEGCALCHGSASGAESMFEALEHEVIAELILIGGEDAEDPGHPDHDGTGGLLGAFAVANSIDLENNVAPDDPAVIAYKAAKWNYALILIDGSYGTHNPGFVRNLIADIHALID